MARVEGGHRPLSRVEKVGFAVSIVTLLAITTLGAAILLTRNPHLLGPGLRLSQRVSEITTGSTGGALALIIGALGFRLLRKNKVQGEPTSPPASPAAPTAPPAAPTAPPAAPTAPPAAPTASPAAPTAPPAASTPFLTGDLKLLGLGRPISVLDYTRGEFRGKTESAQKIRTQAEALDQDFLYLQARGGGNCFYLSYAAGWLQHVLREKAFERAIEKINQFKSDHNEQVIALLKELRENPENFDKILGCGRMIAMDDKETTSPLQPLLNYLREFAVHKVLDAKEVSRDRFIYGTEELFGFEIDGQRIGAAIEGDREVEEACRNEEGILDRNLYAEHQKQDGKNILTPEIQMLHSFFAPLSLYLRDDHPNAALGGRNGLLDSFEPNPWEAIKASRPIVLLQCPNHYDGLLRR